MTIAVSRPPFAGHVAIITVAANGIGLATVKLLHRQGARIFVVGRNDNVNILAREGVVPMVADVAQEASVALAVQAALDHFGRLDILVNVAGIIINKPAIGMNGRNAPLAAQLKLKGSPRLSLFWRSDVPAI